MTHPTPLTPPVTLLRERALARTVALWSSPLDGDGCPAWIESTDRECGKPQTVGLLCPRHAKVAERRFAAEVAKRQAESEKRAAERARLLPIKQARLAQVEAEMARLDPPRPVDRAAYTGYVHPSITKKRRRFLSDSRVSRMAALVEEHRSLTAWLGGDAA